MITFNLFRPAVDTSVWCAVPEDQAVPAFLDTGAWLYSCKVEEKDPLPTGFDIKAALTGVHYNGFYIFENFGTA